MAARDRKAQRKRRNLVGSMVAATGIAIFGLGFVLLISGLLGDSGIQRFTGYMFYVVGVIVAQAGFVIRGPHY